MHACTKLTTFIRFGPLRQHWCMRFESKNAQIKKYVSRSFKNVPLTVAIHHQQWMCHQLATKPNQISSAIFYSGDETLSGTVYNNYHVLVLVMYWCTMYGHACTSYLLVLVMYFYLGNTIEVSEHSSEIRDLCGEPES